jgi:hypothetical protein
MRKLLFSLIVASFFCGLAYSEILHATEKKLETKITFTKNIAPLFQQKCQSCHHKGGIAPMSLVNYEEVRPWARSIKEQVVKRTMPPFYAGGPIGYYHQDPRLSDEQIAMIVEWVDGNAPKGKSSDMPPSLSWPDGWKLGPPDLLLKMPSAYLVRSSERDNYQLFDTGFVFEEDTWIRAMEIRPGNKRVVHHASLYILPDNMKGGADGRIEHADFFIRGGQLFSHWVPGSDVRVHNEGYGALIRKGARFGIQIHYAPTSEAMSDQTSVGFYFANGVIRKQQRSLYGGTDRIEIPPGDSNYQIIQMRRFRTDAVIRAFTIHMHLRGKSFTIRFHHPDGRVETVFELPRFNFNWQRLYKLAKPIPIPKGTVAEYIAVWDNSDKNPFNPDPTKVVRFGEATSDEMMAGTIIYEDPNEDLNILVRNGRQVKEQ